MVVSNIIPTFASVNFGIVVEKYLRIIFGMIYRQMFRNGLPDK